MLKMPSIMEISSLRDEDLWVLFPLYALYEDTETRKNAPSKSLFLDTDSRTQFQIL